MRIVQSGVLSLDWPTEIRQGRAFSLGDSHQAAAGQYPHLQFLNPAGSNRIAVLKSLLVTSDTAGNVHLRRYDTALTTLVDAGFNYRAGGAAGLCTLRKQDNGAALGTFHSLARLNANVPQLVIADWGYELDAGEGVVLVFNTVATTISGRCEWVEIATA